MGGRAQLRTSSFFPWRFPFRLAAGDLRNPPSGVHGIRDLGAVGTGNNVGQPSRGQGRTQTRDKRPLCHHAQSIYTGILGMLLGAALVLGEVWLLLAFVVLSLIFMSRIRREERLMLTTFGEQYMDYMHRVPQVIPGLKPLGK